ncbi:Zinc finger domain containing protein, partial [Globisporangium splendens]
MANEKSATSLALSGLAPSVTESLLTNMFRTYGPILRVSVNGTGGGHVVFAKKASAYKALPATNGAVLEGKPMNVVVVRGFSKTFRPCRGFQAGICRKGDDCKYVAAVAEHNVRFVWIINSATTSSPSIPVVVSTRKSTPAATASTPAAKGLTPAAKGLTPAAKGLTPAATVSVPAATGSVPAVPSHLQGIPSSLVCRHFARGYCSLGSNCRFAHIRGGNAPVPQAPAFTQPPVAAPAPAQPSLQVEEAPKAPAATKRICQYFANGLCSRGDACAFSHDLPVAPAAKEKKTKAPKAEKFSAKAAASVVPVTTQKQTKEESEVPVDAGRTCIECEKPGVAMWQCAKCDDALYCDSCNEAVHKSKVMRTHERTKLPEPVVIKKNPTCDECEETESTVRCEQCDVVLCDECDASVHKFKSLRNHTRKPLTQKTVAATAVAVENVNEPSPKKQKVLKTKATDVPTTTPQIAYVDSVPKYDLTSESDSEPEEDEEKDSDDEDKRPVMPPSTAVAAVPEIAYVESVPKYDLTSESDTESGQEEEEDDEDERPIMPPLVPVQSVVNAAASSEDEDEEEEDNKAATTAPVPAATHNTELSSESSDDDDERPVVLAAPLQRKAVATKAVAPPQTVVAVSSSESSSDEEDERLRVATATSKPAVATESSSSSDSSSDDEDDEDAKPQPKKTAAAPRNPPKVTRGSANPGISSGSSHSLVKKIEAYYESGETEALHLDANLNGFERLLAHDCAERLGLQHVSVGDGLDRHITIFPAEATNKRAGGAQGGSASKRMR